MGVKEGFGIADELAEGNDGYMFSFGVRWSIKRNMRQSVDGGDLSLAGSIGCGIWCRQWASIGGRRRKLWKNSREEETETQICGMGL